MHCTRQASGEKHKSCSCSFNITEWCCIIMVASSVSLTLHTKFVRTFWCHSFIFSLCLNNFFSRIHHNIQWMCFRPWMICRKIFHGKFQQMNSLVGVTFVPNAYSRLTLPLLVTLTTLFPVNLSATVWSGNKLMCQVVFSFCSCIYINIFGKLEVWNSRPSFMFINDGQCGVSVVSRINATFSGWFYYSDNLAMSVFHFHIWGHFHEA